MNNEYVKDQLERAKLGPNFVDKMRQNAFCTGTISSDIYLNECMKKWLISILSKNFIQYKYFVLAWPCHYSKKVTSFLRKLMSQENPPNLPQAMAIEHFWSICKQKYSTRGKTSINQFLQENMEGNRCRRSFRAWIKPYSPRKENVTQG